MKKTIFIVNNHDKAVAAITEYLKNTDEYEIILSTDVDIDINKIASVNEYFNTIDLKAVIITDTPHIISSIEETTDEQWDQAFNNGALTAMLLTRAAGEHFKSHGNGGIILYLGSIHAEKPTGGDFLFSIQSSAMQMMCREAVIAYGKYNVNCFYIQRGIMEHDIENVGEISNTYSGVEHRYPKLRVPDTDNLNGLIGFLLTDSASPLSGSDLKADEGMTLYYGVRGSR